MEFLVYILGLVAFVHCANAYFVSIDAHAEECFFERVSAGTKLGKLLLLFILIFYLKLFNINYFLFIHIVKTINRKIIYIYFLLLMLSHYKFFLSNNLYIILCK